MTQKLDYSREEAMKILNSENYSDDEKRKLYEQYMTELKQNRKNQIVNKLNEYAKNIPVITKEIYISKLKEYESDDLSKPFEVIEQELLNFEGNMKNQYQKYLEKKQEEEIITPDIPAASEDEEENFDDTIFSKPIIEPKQEVVEEEDDIDLDEEVKPSLLITDEISVVNEEVEPDVKPLFETSDKDSKEVIPDESDEKEKGSASAIILSIIAVIIGFVVMYSIIKLN